MEGSRETGEHKSARFHRLIASRLPETLVREALRATRDAVEAQRAGRKTLTRGPSAYFAGIAFSLAEKHGVDLGVKRERGAQTVPTEQGNHGAMGPGVPVQRKPDIRMSGAQAAAVVGEPPPSEEERARIRQMLQEAMTGWGMKV